MGDAERLYVSPLVAFFFSGCLDLICAGLGTGTHKIPHLDCLLGAGLRIQHLRSVLNWYQRQFL